jgi:hypothetical protein
LLVRGLSLADVGVCHWSSRCTQSLSQIGPSWHSARIACSVHGGRRVGFKDPIGTEKEQNHGRQNHGRQASCGTVCTVVSQLWHDLYSCGMVRTVVAWSPDHAPRIRPKVSPTPPVSSPSNRLFFPSPRWLCTILGRGGSSQPKRKFRILPGRMRANVVPHPAGRHVLDRKKRLETCGPKRGTVGRRVPQPVGRRVPHPIRSDA